MITAPSTTSQPLFGGASATASSGGDGTVLSTDFDTFLKMLTAQMKNQDPLNPIESSDYATQLATFSSVEQQVVTNDLLNSMVSLLGANGLNDLAGWVGREVRSVAPVNFDGTPVALSVTPVTGADVSTLEVRAQDGTLVQSFQVDPTRSNFQWPGLDDSGVPFPSGEYSFSVETFAAGESLGRGSVATYNEVIEARVDDGQVYLVLGTGFVVTPEAVTGIRS